MLERKADKRVTINSVIKREMLYTWQHFKTIWILFRYNHKRKWKMRTDKISWKSLRVDGHRGGVNVFVLDLHPSHECPSTLCHLADIRNI